MEKMNHEKFKEMFFDKEGLSLTDGIDAAVMAVDFTGEKFTSITIAGNGKEVMACLCEIVTEFCKECEDVDGVLDDIAKYVRRELAEAKK